MLIDIHSHILPDVDDGAKTIDESLKLLSMLKVQGVGAVVATPHFYASQDDMVEKTGQFYRAFEALKAKTDAELYLGSEVHYFSGIGQSEEIKGLKIGKTDKILIELPFSTDITDNVVYDIESIKYNLGLSPILAHIDRYLECRGFENVLSIIEQETALGQLNADALIVRSVRKSALKLFNDGYIDYIGSDTHSVKSRPPKIAQAMEILNKKGDKDKRLHLEAQAEKLLFELR